MPLRLTRPLTFIIAVLAAGGFAGCESGSPRSSRDRGTGGAPMTASGELAMTNPKPMDAQAAFFGDRIEIEAMLAKSDAVWKNPSPSEKGEPSGGGGRHGGFSGGFGGGGGGGGGHRGGGRRGGGENEAAPQVPGEGTARGPAMRASNAPPVQLQLRVTNHGDTRTVVEVLDFNSDLGNFVVQPAKIALTPHESVEADPMTSRLGVPAVEEIPLTVRLRVDGKMETQVLKLRPRAEPTPSTEPSAH